jgi:hypothetical protein
MQWVRVPIIFPLVGDCWFNRDYNANRGRYRHTGVDIRAAKMTPIVAPFSGIIGIKTESFWIYGDNGWATLGTHLNNDNPGKHDRKGPRDVMFAANLTAGQHVEAGQFIGYVGMSGNATGPHLHFELYAPGKGSTMSRIRNPIPSLKSAIRLARPNLQITQVDDAPTPGVVRLDGCVRYVDPKEGKLMLVLTSTWHKGEKPMTVTELRYVTLKVPDDVLAKIGTWQIFNQIPKTETISVFTPDDGKVDGASALRLRVDPQLAAMK